MYQTTCITGREDSQSAGAESEPEVVSPAMPGHAGADRQRTPVGEG
jgi:hypothetical protein